MSQDLQEKRMPNVRVCSMQDEINREKPQHNHHHTTITAFAIDGNIVNEIGTYI